MDRQLAVSVPTLLIKQVHQRLCSSLLRGACFSKETPCFSCSYSLHRPLTPKLIPLPTPTPQHTRSRSLGPASSDLFSRPHQSFIRIVASVKLAVHLNFLSVMLQSNPIHTYSSPFTSLSLELGSFQHRLAHQESVLTCFWHQCSNPPGYGLCGRGQQGLWSASACESGLDFSTSS